MGRWLGVLHHVGGHMSYWILTEKGKVVSRTTVQHVTNDEASTDEIKNRIQNFDTNVKEILKDDANINTPIANVIYVDDDLSDDTIAYEHDIAEADDYTEDTIDTLLSAEFSFACGGVPERGQVIKRVKDNEGRPVGKRHKNPLFDTRVYEVMMRDGTILELTANKIIENIYSQCDTEGKEHLNFSSIVDHKTDGTQVHKDDGYITSHNGNQSKRITTKGWLVLVEWKDGTTAWLPLRQVKDSNPIELAEYAVQNKLQDEPAFAWWVTYTLQKRDRIVSKVKSRYWKTTHKFGIRLPHSVEEAL